MSTSLLYHAYSIKGVQYKSTVYEKGTIIFITEMTRKYAICPKCKNFHTIFKGKQKRRFHMIPYDNKRCFLDVYIHRLECPQCHHLWWPHLPFMYGTRRMTRSFVHFALNLLQFASIEAVAKTLSISWNTLRDLHKEKLQRMYPNILYEEIEAIGIDEFSLKKGHKYMAIVTHLRTGQILYAKEGKNKEAVLPFLKKLHKKAPHLKVVAMDMSKSFAAAVKEAIPKVKIVFDHFHVTALINDTLEEIRRKEQRYHTKKGIKALKGSKYLLLKNYENLDQKKRQSLKSLLAINADLSVVYVMKEQFRLFWQKNNQKEGARFLCRWILDAVNTGIKPLMRVAKTLLNHSDGLLNYFIYRISNGKIEGINNKIKTLKRQAYGYRDMKYFKLRLYHLHNQNYSLTG